MARKKNPSSDTLPTENDPQEVAEDEQSTIPETPETVDPLAAAIAGPFGVVETPVFEVVEVVEDGVYVKDGVIHTLFAGARVSSQHYDLEAIRASERAGKIRLRTVG